MQDSPTLKRFAVPLIIVAEIALLGLLVWLAWGAPVDGVMVNSSQAFVEAADQKVFDAVAVSKVKTPVDSWVVVRALRDGKPGEVIGYTRVKAGETSPVMVKINQQRGVPRDALVVLYADRNTRGQFEFTGPMLVTDASAGMGMSMGDSVSVAETGTAEAEAEGGMAALEDKPLYAGRELVATTVGLSRFNVGIRPGEALLENAVLDPDGQTVRISQVKAPGPSWIAVSTGGMGPGGTGKVLKTIPFEPGEKNDVAIKLDTPAGADPLVVSLHADLGQRGEFEFDPTPDKNDKVDIVDKLYFLDLSMISLPVLPATAPPMGSVGSSSTPAQ